MGRIAIFQYLMVAVFLFLLAAFWVLQVRNHEANSELAERNRIKTVPLVAPRGKILDRDGRVIVDNRPSYRVLLTQENLLPEHLDAIAEGLHLDADELRSRVRRYGAGPKYVPVPIKQGLTPTELTFVESHRDPETFPEMELVQDQNRLYPHNDYAAHVIGYVGEVSEAELNTSEFAKYSQGEIVGKAGLERQYNDVLMGEDGQRRVVVDSTGREREVLERKEATPGRSLQLTLDLDLQSVAELAMDGRRGAVVALDPRNGEVLAMVSRPAFDPNLFTNRIRQADWNELMSNPDNPLFNRAISAQFAPGSTFKPIVSLAGLETGDHRRDVHGALRWQHRFLRHLVPLRRQARNAGPASRHRAVLRCLLLQRLGNKIGIDKIAEYAQMVGIGKRTGIDLPNEAEGPDALAQVEAARRSARNGTRARPSRWRSDKAR